MPKKWKLIYTIAKKNIKRIFDRIFVIVLALLALTSIIFGAFALSDLRNRQPDPPDRVKNQLAILDKLALGGEVSQGEFESSGLSKFKPEDIKLTLEVYKYGEAEQKEGLKRFLAMRQASPSKDSPPTENRAL